MSTSPTYFFRDNKAGADVNATAGSNGATGLNDANAKQTYGHLLSLLNTAPAGTKFRLARSCGFSSLATFRITNGNSVTEITSITRSASTATATVAKNHNLQVSDSFTIENCVQTEYNGVITVLTVPTSTTFTYAVTGTPATPATIDARSNAIRFDGSTLTIEEYTSTAAGGGFDAAVDKKAHVEYADSQNAMHNFDTTSNVDGFTIKGVDYLYTGPTGGGARWIFCYSGLTNAVIADDVVVNGFSIAIYWSQKGVAPSRQYDCKLINSAILNNWSQGVLGSPRYSLIDNNIFHNNGHNNGFGAPTLHNIYQNSNEYTTISNNDLYQSALNAGNANGVSLVVHGVDNGLIIEDNIIREDVGAANNNAWSIGVDPGYSTAESFTDVIVRRNTCINGGNTGIHATSNINCLYENNVIINQNPAANMRGLLFDGLNAGAGDAVNTGNTIRNNSMYGYITIGARINTGTGFSFMSNVMHSIATGTVDMIDTGALSIVNTTNFTSMDNNTMHASGAAVLGWARGIGNLAAWQAASIFDTNSQTGDPLYTNVTPGSENLKQLAGSPLINFGHTTLSALSDFDKLTRDATPDAGAYELGGTGALPVTSTLSGTSVTGMTETNTVNGGKTTIITLANDTWVTAGAAFNAQRQAIINGVGATQSTITGWNNEVRDKEVVTAVVRTSATVVTITWSASALYSITANETIQSIVPITALTLGASAVVSMPTFLITADAAQQPAAVITGTSLTATEIQMVVGGLTTIITLSDTTWVAAGATFNAQRQAIINGVTSSVTEPFGWNNEIRNKEAITSVTRTSSTVVTIVWSAAAAYAITSNDGPITVTIPGGAYI